MRAQVLSPAVQPRALWVVAHHLEVGSGVEGAWMHLLRALAAALAGNDDLVNARRCEPRRNTCHTHLYYLPLPFTFATFTVKQYGVLDFDAGRISLKDGMRSVWVCLTQPRPCPGLGSCSLWHLSLSLQVRVCMTLYLMVFCAFSQTRRTGLVRGMVDRQPVGLQLNGLLVVEFKFFMI